MSPVLFSLLVNGVGHNLASCKVLCNADDMKLFMKIESPKDCVKLQNDLDHFITWFQALGMIFNFDKCHNL